MMTKVVHASDPVVFFTNGLGDYLLNLPAIRALGYIFQGRMTLVCAEGEQCFLLTDVPLRRIIKTQFRRINGQREFPADEVAVEIGKSDLLISLVPWHSKSLTDLISRLAPVLSIGFRDSFDLGLPLDFSKHTSDLAFDVVRYFDPDRRWEQFAQPPVYPEFAKRLVSKVRRTAEGVRFLAVHADTAAEKMWDPERFRLVISSFLDNHPEFMVLLVGWDDYGLERGPHSDRIVPLYRLNLPASLYFVASADFFLGVDSCCLHAADFSRVPSVGLFGPTNHKEFGFKIAPNITIQADGSMMSIEVEHVLSALENIVSKPNQFAVCYSERKNSQSV